MSILDAGPSAEATAQMTSMQDITDPQGADFGEQQHAMSDYLRILRHRLSQLNVESDRHNATG